MRSQDVYKIVRTVIGPRCKELGLKRTKQAAGWYKKLECGFFTWGLSTSHWDGFGGGILAVSFEMSEEKLDSTQHYHSNTLRLVLGELLSKPDQRLAGKMHNEIIAKLRMPPQTGAWRTSDIMVRHYRNAMKPWAEGMPDLRYLDESDIENWSRFVRDRLATVIDDISTQWTQQNPDAEAIEQGPAVSYLPWDNIVQSPNDDEPRLVYADWLDERGDARGEFIRLQCELGQQANQREGIDKLERRSRELLREHREDWIAEFAKLPVTELEFNRGFINKATITAHQFIQHGQQIFRAMPLLTHVRLKSAGKKLRDLAECECLSKVESVTPLNPQVRRITDWQVFWNSPYWTRLHEISFARMRPRSMVIATLTHSAIFQQISSLDLQNCGLHDSLDDLLGSPHLSNLRKLNLNSNRISSVDAERIANCRDLSDLEELDLGNNAMGGRGVAFLARSPYLKRLRVLRIPSVRLTAAGMEALAAPDRLPALERLEYWDSGIGKEHVDRLRKRNVDVRPM